MVPARKARIVEKIKQPVEASEDFYDNEFIELSAENDQISAEEQGFMAGYLNS